MMNQTTILKSGIQYNSLSEQGLPFTLDKIKLLLLTLTESSPKLIAAKQPK
jgi:hypothetical protein